jgi:hypothetical protein
MRARAHRKRNAIRQPMRVPPENVAVLAANFVAAIAVISLNKRAFVYFPFPAALTSFHYFLSWAGIEALRHAGKFEPRPVPPGNERTFYTLIVCWSACNALSNVSLDRNSVGFYQLAKLMITPSLVAFDFVCYGRRTTLGQAVALLLSCAGVGLASVNDVQLHAVGAAVACAAVITAAMQKVTNSHVQQFGGMTSLQVMHNAYPSMALLSLAYIPLMDRRLHLLVSLKWATAPAMQWVFASGVAAFCATWSATLIFGMISALAHVLLGQVKTCSVVVVGAVFYDAHQTTGGIFGAALALASITVYSLLKLPGPSKAEAARPLTQAAEGDSEDEEGRLGR